jgi:hypothetical protein
MVRNFASKCFVSLELSRSRAADRVHLVIAIPVERNCGAITPAAGSSSEGLGDTGSVILQQSHNALWCSANGSQRTGRRDVHSTRSAPWDCT